MKKYLKMKDSGIKWIEKIPEDWKIIKIRFIGKIQTSGINKKIKEDEKRIKLVNYLDIYDNKKKIIDNKTKFTYTSCKNQQSIDYNLNEGDVLFTPSSETTEEIGFSAVVDEKLPDVVFSYHLVRLRFKKEFDKNFKKYMFNNYFVLNNFSQYARGTTRQTLKIIDFQETKILIPTLNEQKSISKFLDKKIGYLDNLLTNVEKEIILLEEKKVTLIDHMVTKGIEEETKLKDSELKWIGDIPESWKIIPLKYILVQKMDNGIFKKKEQYGSGIPLVNVGDLYQRNNIVNQKTLERVIVDDDELTNFSVKSNDIFFVRSSLKEKGIGISCIVNDVKEPLVFECHIIRTRPNSEKINPLYLKFLLNSSKFLSRLLSVSHTVTMTTISQDDIKNLKIICPSLSEQKLIVNYLEKQNKIIDETILNLQSQLEKLHDYKKSLIASSISGNIDLRETIA